MVFDDGVGTQLETPGAIRVGLDRPAHAARGLHDRHAPTAPGEAEGRGQAGDAGAHDQGVQGGVAQIRPLRNRRAVCSTFDRQPLQSSIRSPSNPAKSEPFDVTSTRSLAQATAAIWPSRKGGVLPIAWSRARSAACQAAAARS